jgi:hypothetical protein
MVTFWGLNKGMICPVGSGWDPWGYSRERSCVAEIHVIFILFYIVATSGMEW